jgi:endonuclease/exonuclease/phosphatase (EEP) superfamily protein YafD
MTPRTILHVATCVIVSLVLLAIGTRYVHPHWLFAAVHSLQLHFAAACVIAMLFAILLHRNIAAILLLVVSLAFTGHALAMGWQTRLMAEAGDADAPTFRLLSFNILSSNYQNSEAIVRMIVASGADIVNIMEAEPLQGQIGALSDTYPYRIGCGILVLHCDQLMLSRTPLRRGVIRSLGPIFENRFILAETEIAGRTVHVGGIHTTKPYFDNFQTLELLRAALAITDTDGPFVLSGDFNASSLAPNVRNFLDWTDLHTATYEPPTWPVRLGVFGLPIDHVYVRPPLKFRSLSSLPSTFGSNHAGLIADIAITGQ